MKKLIIILLIICLLAGGVFLLYKIGFITFRRAEFSGNLYPPKNSNFYLYYDLSDIPLENFIKDEKLTTFLSYTEKNGSIFFVEDKENSFVASINAKRGKGNELVMFLTDEIEKGGGVVEKKKISSFTVYEIVPSSENLTPYSPVSQPFYVSSLKDTVIFTTSIDTFKSVIYTKKEDSLLNTEGFKKVLDKVPLDSNVFGYFNANSQNVGEGGFYTEFHKDALFVKGFYNKINPTTPVPLSETILRFVGENPFFIFGVRDLGNFLSQAVSSLQEENPLISGFTQGFDILGFLSLFNEDVIVSLDMKDGKPNFVVVSNLRGVEKVGQKLENFKNYLSQNFNFSFKEFLFEDAELILGRNSSGVSVAISILSNFLFLGSEEGVKNSIISGKIGENKTLNELLKGLGSDVPGDITTILFLDFSKLKNFGKDKVQNLSSIYFVTLEEKRDANFILKVEFKKQ
ncbi:MAG: hypothetical protein DRI28_01175 [Caldiserica bacterium]|nr:MAG: hypothetical protein DRI28_01175 [Caldisericota bacterium]